MYMMLKLRLIKYLTVLLLLGTVMMFREYMSKFTEFFPEFVMQKRKRKMLLCKRTLQKWFLKECSGSPSIRQVVITKNMISIQMLSLKKRIADRKNQ